MSSAQLVQLGLDPVLKWPIFGQKSCQAHFSWYFDRKQRLSGLFLRFWDMKKYISAINHQFTRIIPLRLDPALTAKVYRELQVLYREIGLQGSHIYRDLSCVILLVIIRLILYKIKGIIGKS